MSFMSLFVKPGDEQPRKRKRNVKDGLQPITMENACEDQGAQCEAACESAPPPLADLLDQEFFLPSADPMFYKPEDYYQQAMSLIPPSHQVAQHLSSLSIAREQPLIAGQKSCSVCGRQESKTCKIGHRLQACKERSHSECKLVCNSCEDFFRRHSGAVNIKEHCESSDRDPRSCRGGKSSRNCQFHRYERCLEVGMQPVPAKPLMDARSSLSPVRSPPPEHAAAAGPAAALSPAAAGGMLPSGFDLVPAPPAPAKPWLPTWERAHNDFQRPDLLWRAFCASLSISSSAAMPGSSIEEFLAQKIEYSDLLRKYSCEEASAIWHERGSLRLCVETFFTPSPCSQPADFVASTVPVGNPVCVQIDFVAQKQMKLGRDLVPFQVPADLPLHPRLYDRYRSSIPSLVAFIERKEKTITPPFSTQGSYNPASLSVAFVLTSKIPGKTWLYVRRSQTQIVTAISPDVPFELQHGDTLSIYNEQAPMAEHIAWRVSVPQV